MNGSAGKGDKRRPMQISQEEYRRRWELAFGQIKTKRAKRLKRVKTPYGEIWVTPDLYRDAVMMFSGDPLVVVKTNRRCVKITNIGGQERRTNASRTKARR